MLLTKPLIFHCHIDVFLLIDPRTNRSVNIIRCDLLFELIIARNVDMLELNTLCNDMELQVHRPRDRMVKTRRKLMLLADVLKTPLTRQTQTSS